MGWKKVGGKKKLGGQGCGGGASLAGAAFFLPSFLPFHFTSSPLPPPSPSLPPGLQDYGGGVVIVSHHHEFVNQVCQEKWTVGGGKVDVTGQSAAAMEAQKLEW